ncbi:ABC transporter substrate-binding protein [Neobacillus vireti]|uniref:ABC transporter substrate-binding protein n=1 Tax=Neobacillus vireti TaxID=220686 RepID=UPI002FFEE470
MKRLTVKKLLALLIVGILMLSIVGCSGGNQKSSADENKPVTIRFSFDQGVGKPTQKIVDKYNASQNKVHVETVILPQDANAVHDDFVNKLASGDKSVDVMALDVVYVAEFAAANWLEDLGKYFDKSTQSKYLPGTIEGATYNGKLVAFPWFTNASVLFYRKDVLDQLGIQPPTTYKGWMALADKVKGVNGVKYVSNFQAAQSEALVCNWVEYVWNNGGNVLNGKGAPVVNSENNVEATKTMLDLVKNYSPEGITTYKEPESEQVFLDGKSLFIRDWSGFWNTFNADGSKVAGKVGVTSLPIGANGQDPHSALGGLDLVINKAIDDEHKAAAADFLKYMASAETQKDMTLTAAQPPVLKSVYEDADVLNAIPFYKEFYGIIEGGKSRPMSPKYAKVSDAIQRNIHKALTGEVEVKAALDQLQKELKELSK